LQFEQAVLMIAREMVLPEDSEGISNLRKLDPSQP
jgi:hypothetical protein